jgi:hypothetical protein
LIFGSLELLEHSEPAQAYVGKGGVYDGSNIVRGVIPTVINNILRPSLLPKFRLCPTESTAFPAPIFMEPTRAEQISYTDVYPNGAINTENVDRNSFAPVNTPIFTKLTIAQ